MKQLSETLSVVPVIDLECFPDCEEYKKLREASEEWGCFRLFNHKIPLTLMSEMTKVIKSLLDLPKEIKSNNKDVIPGSGYMGNTYGNPLFESLGLYDMGSSEAVQTFCSQVHASSYQREVIEKYAEAMHEQIADIWQKLTESFGLETTVFKGWPCHLRLNKYHFSPETVGDPGVLHSDPGFLTIVQYDQDVGGLKVMDKSGAFVHVDPHANALLVNLGDIAKSWSNGKLCNVKHRVECMQATTRYSISAFLLGPNEESIGTPSEFIDSKHPRLYSPFTYEEYRQLRISTKSPTGEALELLRTKS